MGTIELICNLIFSKTKGAILDHVAKGDQIHFTTNYHILKYIIMICWCGQTSILQILNRNVIMIQQ